MKFLNKMERKFGKYAIRNLTKYIILTYIAVSYTHLSGLHEETDWRPGYDRGKCRCDRYYVPE